MKQNLFQVGLLAGLVLALSACQSTPSANKTQAQADRSKHQKDHGASTGHRAAFIDDYDLNGNEVVTRAEYEQARAEKLKAMDANGNGLVDESEYLDHFAQTLKKKISAERKAQVEQTEIRFKSIDTNGDGKMTWDEYWASGAKTFTHFAKSIDGVVTLDAKDKEWDAAPSAQQDANQQQGVSLTPAADVVRPSVLRMPSSHSLEGFIDINDLDGDQQVTAAEFKQIRRGIFDSTDTNKDGWVNPEEYTLEFTDRLDRLAKQVRTGQMKQAKVRYEILNINKDAGITVEEFAVSGTRIFDGWDLNNDGQVTATDPLPQIKNDSKKSTAALAKASAKGVKQ